MTIKAGESVPQGEFAYVPWSPELEDAMVCGSPVKYSTDAWKGKKVVVVSVVGAFTGTCHGQIPAYKQLINKFKESNVDVVAIVNANDPFVNSGWARVQGLKGEIIVLSDTASKWTKELGLDVDLTAVGLGVRTGRWALVLNDLKVTALEVEPHPAKVTVTAAEEVLKKL
ncbi:Redoxin [Auricularia subglabra TFB-10046 SS5]|uniref:Redoxin n=1 Tax=Auricularia subglabra (strain TFB-10046 / SS5) TaxID=717982 RepID=J0LK14_AURST|nr:Redoxin [Auricularia subglabra TFB-10046 SS5]